MGTTTSVWAGAIAQPSRSDPPKDPETGINATLNLQAAANQRSAASEIFTPHLDEIRQKLPASWVMRLPTRVPVSKAQQPATTPWVRVFQFASPNSLTVSLFRCDTGASDCLLASFSVESSTSATAQAALQQHQAAAAPLTLGGGLQGYLWDGAQHQQPFSSVVWQQDGMLYTVSVPAPERQALLYAAVDMANAQPIPSLLAATETPSAVSAPPQGASPTADRARSITQPPPSPTAAPGELPTASEPVPSQPNDRPIAQSLQAQNVPTQPDRDRFLQSRPSPQPLPDERPVIPLPSVPAVEPPTTPTEPQPLIPVSQVDVIGSTVLSTQDIDAITKPLKGRSVTLQELTDAADRLTQLYLDRGYITSRAVLERQTIANGVVQMRVIEGKIEKINIEGTQRLKPSYVLSRVALGVTTPLNARKLEDQLRLLLVDPLFKNIVPTLQAGSQEGQSILTVQVTEAPPFGGGVSFDNLSPPSVGSERAGINLRYRNLTGIGDELSGSYYRSTTGGSNLGSIAYRVPLNPMDGSLELRADINRNRITQSPFDELNIKGASEQYEISYRQPLFRSPREEFALSLGFAFQDGQTFIFNDVPNAFGIGPDQDGVSRTSVVKLGQDYVRRDTGGAWSVRSQLNVGTGLFGATDNRGSDPDGQFVSWLGQIQRVQRLSEGQLLIAQLDLQLTPDSLLPSQQFVIGGGQSIRGYRQNARTGDNGIRASVENRITLNRDRAGNPTLQVAPFVDLGAVWNVASNPNQLPKQTFLIGAGLGVLWKPFSGLNLRLDYGIPIIDLSDRGNNLQDHGFYFTVNYEF
ncbi:ShlB/FhaC/HecB family hemolysin secretion/activation protein [Stenomitos frigidus]|nr:ShlB/FhaC/HecB family hemolysin secretion/activation protein [Stenomitos frigidus]